MEAGKIESILVPNGNEWQSADVDNIVGIIAQTVANYLHNKGLSSTTQLGALSSSE